MWKALASAGLAIGLGLGTTACTNGYGYNGVSVGYNSGYYDNGYGDPGYASYYGWYGDYYYPGTGYYVYDRYQRPYRWNDGQRRYWETRRGAFGNRAVRDNWNDFRRDVRDERRDYRGDLRGNREAYRAGTINRDQFRQGRRDARQEYRGDVRQDYRTLRRENRAEGVRTPRPNRALDPRPGRGRR